MNKSFVMVTALPPTKGHLHLFEFARGLGELNIIICTQPNEPFVNERVNAISQAFPYAWIHHVSDFIRQDPKEPDFRMWWANNLTEFGCSQGDYIVSSELYGLWLADLTGARFMPYDISRDIYPCKATLVRQDSENKFHHLMPSFQPYVKQIVTFFGAESTGKTTLSKQIATTRNGHWLFEWARPYLETVGKEITTLSMTEIWQGQRALQDHGHYDLENKPWIFQDTDLFSTVGYWDFWNMNTPPHLVSDAKVRASDLYIICPSNIPFEADPLRYGGDKRESTDQYWINLCKRYSLNYRVLTSSDPDDRLLEVNKILNKHWQDNVVERFVYERECN